MSEVGGVGGAGRRHRFSFVALGAALALGVAVLGLGIVYRPTTPASASSKQASAQSTPGGPSTVTDAPGHVYYVNTVTGEPTTREAATSTSFANDADLVYASAGDTGATVTLSAKTVESNTDAAYTPAGDPNWTENDTYIGWEVDTNSGANPNYAVYFALNSAGAYDGSVFHLGSGRSEESCTVSLSYSQTSGYVATLPAACIGGAKSFVWNVFSHYDPRANDPTGKFAIGKALPDPYDGGARFAPTVTAGSQTATANGYWLEASDGGVFSFGSANFYGSMGGTHLNAPIVGGAATPDGRGYWLVASDGGIFTFGDARFYGSMGGSHLNQPIVGMAATPTGGGYWLVASDGGIFTFGNATFHGSTGNEALSKPIVGVAGDPAASGYWLVEANGKVFPFGAAASYGDEASANLSKPIVGMAPAPTGKGYWLVGSDGGIFAFGQASFFGSTGGIHLNAPIKAVTVAVAS